MLCRVRCTFGTAHKHDFPSTRPDRCFVERSLVGQHVRRMLSAASTDRTISFAPVPNPLLRCGASRTWLRNDIPALHTRQRSGQATCSAISASPCKGTKSVLLVEARRIGNTFTKKPLLRVQTCSHKLWLEMQKGTACRRRTVQ